MDLKKSIGRRCYLILHPWKTYGNYSKEKDRKLSIFGFDDKAAMGILTIGINSKTCP